MMTAGRAVRRRSTKPGSSGADHVLRAKYASCFFAPFRDRSAPRPRSARDKRTYQMDPANGDEALREVRSTSPKAPTW